MTVDFTALDRLSEVLDEDEAAELEPARKSSGRPAQYVEWFLTQDGPRFVPAEALGERTVKSENGSSRAAHDLKSLQALAGGIRKYAREQDQDVNAKAVRREGVLGIRFTAEEPEYHEGRGRPRSTPAE